MLATLLLGLALALAPPAAASVASPPWCGAAELTDAERMICVDDILSRLDLELNEVHAAARRVAGDLDQRAWLAERDRCGARVLCLEESYRARIAELRAIAWPQEATARGDGRPVDEARDEDEALDAMAAGAASAFFDGLTPRPWCAARRLNPTERTICDDRALGRLDALLDLAYGRAAARDRDRAQLRWLRGERDACGTDRLCIGRAYATRIERLVGAFDSTAEPDPREREHEIAREHRPPPGMCRVWYLGRPPETQPPPSSCNVRVPAGAVLLRG
jgi:uncharacterized protein